MYLQNTLFNSLFTSRECVINIPLVVSYVHLYDIDTLVSCSGSESVEARLAGGA